MNQEQKENIKTLCIFNDLEDIELALKHDYYAYQGFLPYSDEELQGAIEHYYDDEYISVRNETKQDNYQGDYEVTLQLKSFKLSRSKEEFDETIKKALKDYGLEVKTISSKKL